MNEEYFRQVCPRLAPNYVFYRARRIRRFHPSFEDREGRCVFCKSRRHLWRLSFKHKNEHSLDLFICEACAAKLGEQPCGKKGMPLTGRL